MCLGPLRLEGHKDLKVAGKHLLLLSYARLEGVNSRAELARLFWSHLASSYTPKGVRKDLSNLAVARAVLSRELDVDIEDPAQLASLESDVSRFEDALERGAFADALDLYRQGLFLEGIEDKPRLKLSAELYSWLEERRTQLAQNAQDALAGLAQQPETRQDALYYAEDIFRLSLYSSDLHLWGHLHRTLSQLGSPQEREAQAVFAELVASRFDDISQEALTLYLTLSLQGVSNLAAAQVAADLSPKVGAACLGELRSANLVTAESYVINQEVAHHYFASRPQEKMALLSRLREHTPAEQAYRIYRAIYELSQTFGGVGYWEGARTAYCYKAKLLIDKGDFGAAADALAQFEEAEYHAQRTPGAENRFLQAYALERLRRYKQGLKVLVGVEQTPEITAMNAALFSRTSDFQEAKKLAQQVRAMDASTPRMFWAKAIALNTLGQIAYEENSLLEAEMCFSQATIQWALAGHPQRELGALMNRANILEELKRSDEARGVYEEVLEKCEDDVLRVRTLLNLGFRHEELEEVSQALSFYLQAHAVCETQNLKDRDMGLVAIAYNNLGHIQWKLGHSEAHANLSYAADLALKAGERLSYAGALSNLALVERDIAKLAVALELLEQLGSHRELMYYSELYKQLLQARIGEAKKTQDTKSLHFLEETFASFCGVEA